ncbi:hypothetical protein MTO96_037867 [Rhipicephalus appendiculatus]
MESRDADGSASASSRKREKPSQSPETKRSEVWQQVLRATPALRKWTNTGTYMLLPARNISAARDN